MDQNWAAEQNIFEVIRKSEKNSHSTDVDTVNFVQELDGLWYCTLNDLYFSAWQRRTGSATMLRTYF